MQRRRQLNRVAEALQERAADRARPIQCDGDLHGLPALDDDTVAGACARGRRDARTGRRHDAGEGRCDRETFHLDLLSEGEAVPDRTRVNGV